MDWNREAPLFADVVSAARRIIYLTRSPPEEEPEWVEFLERGMFHIFVAIFYLQAAPFEDPSFGSLFCLTWWVSWKDGDAFAFLGGA